MSCGRAAGLEVVKVGLWNGTGGLACDCDSRLFLGGGESGSGWGG